MLELPRRLPAAQWSRLLAFRMQIVLVELAISVHIPRAEVGLKPRYDSLLSFGPFEAARCR